MMNGNKPCIRCLLAELPDQAQLAETVAELIRLMPEEQRTSECERARRLSICKRCERLNSGTCVLCGCYVELRSAKAHMHCPDCPGKW